MLRRAVIRRSVILGGIAALSAPVLPRFVKAAGAPDSLDGPRLAAATAPAEWLVVLCHGSGGDGPNMMGLAPALQGFLPSAAFVSPTGPFPREDFGYRWFPGALGNDAIGMVNRGMREGAPVFNKFLDEELARLGLGADRLILLGFSQGSMMVLNAGLRRTPLPAAIISFAGLRLSEDDLPQFSNAPPVLLVLGALERNPDGLRALAENLSGRGVPVESHLLPGIGHTIDRRGITLAGEFMQKVARETSAGAG
jgi:phospholipase/carboxylesterase